MKPKYISNAIGVFVFLFWFMTSLIIYQTFWNTTPPMTISDSHYNATRTNGIVIVNHTFKHYSSSAVNGHIHRTITKEDGSMAIELPPVEFHTKPGRGNTNRVFYISGSTPMGKYCVSMVLEWTQSLALKEHSSEPEVSCFEI